MKLTYLMWGYPHDTTILQTFKEAGVTINTISLPKELLQYGKEPTTEMFYLSLKEQIQTAAGDFVFSINFFAWVSYLCQKEGISYCCWILQLPNFDLYTTAIRNSCNFFWVCDSYLLEKLWQLGISNSFFLPDAVEPNRPEKAVPIEREACFIARCPEDILSTEGMTLYSKGYLDAFLHAQRVLYGAYILENGLLLRVQQEFLNGHSLPNYILPEMQKLFLADQYFAPACTRIQQNIFLQNFASIMTIYSNGDFSGCDSEKRPFIESETERQKIYREKEFTLILAPHTLHNGIPRDLLEVIAVGGFPIAGFQRDYAYFFQKDQTLAYFTNPSEFSQAVVRYGNSPEERERVKEAAYQLLIKGHTYRHRINTLLENIRKLNS